MLIFFFGVLLIFLLPPSITLADTQIQTGTTPTTAFLQIGDQVLLDQPGFHLSKPTLSPDGRWLAVTVVPSGAGTAFLAEIYLFDTNDGVELARLQGYSPTWSADSLQLHFEAKEGAFAYFVLEQRLAQLTFNPRNSDDDLILTLPQLPLAYPQTIRVAHHPSNGCRTVADWQVDVIPFEAYVAHVLPAEVPASWPAAALEAMAVAARTYAWRQILVGRRDYDVTDWANFQMMCADRYPSTDAAVSATAGQYLTAKSELPGLPISAMYSAENGHPTLTNPNVTYLQAVPDLFALGKERWGHGYGLSQWGAYRRARAGQTYRQILGHYYSAVYLQNGLEPAQSVAGLMGLPPQAVFATNSLYLRAIGPADAALRFVMTDSTGLASPGTLPGDAAIWRAAQPLPDNVQVTAQLWLQDQLQDQVTLTVDRTAPDVPELQAPEIVTQPVAAFSAPALANTMPMLKTHWSWQGEDLLHTANSGATVPDAQTADGVAWVARTGVHQKGVWYGPYTTALPAGYSYRALFWLRAGQGTSEAVAAHVVARLDVTDDEGRELLGLRDLWTSDFVDPDRYLPIAVDFHLFQAPRGLEFRVAWPGLVDLALDRIEIWRLPSTSSSTLHHFSLPLYGQAGELALDAAQMDSAGNLSQSAGRIVKLIDRDPPQVGPWPLPTTWLTTNTLTVSVPITDSFSGLDLSRGRFVLEGEGESLVLPVTFSPGKLPWQGHTMTTLLAGAPDGEYTFSLEATDRAGNLRTEPYPLRIDTQPPTVTLQISVTPINGWYGEPLLLSLAAIDKASGVAYLDYSVAASASAEVIVQRYTEPVMLATGGVHHFTYRATDQAGNVTATRHVTVALDLAAPVVTLHQFTFGAEQVRIGWQIQDDGAGVALVEMQVQQGDGAWQAAPWDYTTLTTAEIDLNPELLTTVRARAQDHFGRLSEWVTLELWSASAWSYLPVVQR